MSVTRTIYSRDRLWQLVNMGRLLIVAILFVSFLAQGKFFLIKINMSDD